MDRLFGIVLAAGNGQRVDGFIRRLGGRQIPKQFYAFTGRRSMLQHTLARVETLVPRERVVVVVSADHAAFVRAQLADRPEGMVIAQPRNLDTLPGILLPLVHALRRDPDATVAVFPSDHFIWDEARFMESVKTAARAAEERPDRIVLLGVTPDTPEADYGWIAPSPDESLVAGRVRGVHSFHEKPGPNRGRIYLRNGYLWNTLVCVAKAATVYEMAREVAPHMMAYFDVLRHNLNTAHEAAIVRGMYARMEPLNVSKDLFQRMPHRLLVMPVEGAGWSDWGREERVRETLDRYGLVLREGARPKTERAHPALALQV